MRNFGRCSVLSICKFYCYEHCKNEAFGSIERFNYNSDLLELITNNFKRDFDPIQKMFEAKD